MKIEYRSTFYRGGETSMIVNCDKLRHVDGAGIYFRRDRKWVDFIPYYNLVRVYEVYEDVDNPNEKPNNDHLMGI